MKHLRENTRKATRDKISNMLTVMQVEGLKMFRSNIFGITIMAAILLPLLLGLYTFILKNPEIALNMGLLARGGQLKGTVDWPIYFSLLTQMISGMSILMFGFVASWLFGREYSDRTIKDLLALPVSRFAIVTAKFIVAALWGLLLFSIAFFLALLIGNAIQLDGWSTGYMLQALSILSGTAILVLLASTPVAFWQVTREDIWLPLPSFSYLWC